MTVIAAPCPFCDWRSQQSSGHQPEDLVTAYVAKALMDHLRLKHARHDESRIQNLAFSTILSQRTKQGMIEFSFNDQMSQWDLDKAREIHRMLGEAIEAAVSDTLMYRFFRERVGLDDDKAAEALLDLRNYRHGSKDPIHAS